VEADSQNETVSEIEAPEIQVLVVDDDAFFRATVRETLEASGIEVEEASNAEEAMRAISCTMADVMILDFLLPEGTGIEVWEFCRRQNARLAQRTIILTGVMDGPERLQMAEHMELPVIGKPFEPDVLVHMVQRLFRD